MKHNRSIFSCSKLAARLTPELFVRVLLLAPIPIFFVYFGRALTNEAFEYVSQKVLENQREDIGLLFGTIALQFFFEIAWGAVWAFLTICAVGAANRSQALFSQAGFEDFNQLIVENIRSIAAVIWRLPFLIVPALVEFVRLVFVSHVTLLDPRYKRGEIDALDRSRKLVKGRFVFLALTMLIVTSINATAGMLLRSGDFAWAWQSPVPFFAKNLFLLLLNLFFEIFLVSLFLVFLENEMEFERADV